MPRVYNRLMVLYDFESEFDWMIMDVTPNPGKMEHLLSILVIL